MKNRGYYTTYMKKLFSALAVLVVLVSPSAALASAVVRSGDTVSVAQNQSVDGNFYGVGSAVVLSGVVKGDAVMIGGNVTVNGSIIDDLLVIGGAVNMSASGTKDVRIVGGDVTISKPIMGDLVVVGGRVTILSTASVKGDVLLYGEDATIDGDVGGQVLGNIRTLRVNSAVGGGVDVTTTGLTLGDQANVTGDVQYASQNGVVRSPNAVVTGKVMQGTIGVTAANDTATLAREVATLFFISLFATLCMYLIARRFVEDMARLTIRKFGFKTLVGFATFAIAPITIGILFVSMLGILVGVIELAFLIVLSVVSLVLMNAVFGALIAKYMFKKNQLTVPFIIAGAAVTQICLLIPYVGMVALVFAFLATAGALVTSFYYRVINRGQ
jgi:cytoskeletal protein CcmA (bactofilin family)